MLPRPLENLIKEFSQFPGIGPKTAQRFIFYLLKKIRYLDAFCQKVQDLKKIRTCRFCFNLSETEVCPICQDKSRDHSLICLVASPTDLEAIEEAGAYRGVYEVLGGLLDPTHEINPDSLHIEHFLNRLRREPIKEVIFALSPTLEGETTLIYLLDLIKNDSRIPKNIKLTRLAKGLSSGLELEYVDSLTLSEALKDRRSLK